MTKFKKWVSNDENKIFMNGLTDLIILIIAVFMLVFMISLVWRIFNDYKELVSNIYNTFGYITN